MRYLILFVVLLSVAACEKSPDVQTFAQEKTANPVQAVQTPEISAEPCFKHQVNCPAPGGCGLFEDKNKNGICDASEVQ